MLLFKSRIKKFMELLKKEKIDIYWSCNGRVDSIRDCPEDRQLLKDMKNSGCWQILFGIESGCDEILKELAKGTNKEQIKTAVNMVHEAGIRTKGFLMIGNPKETDSTLRETLDLIKKINLDDIGLTFLTPFPGSKLHEIAENYGWIDKDWKKMNFYNIVFIPFGLTEEKMKEWMKRYYREFYFRPKVIFNYIKRLNGLHQLKELAASVLMLTKYVFKKDVS